MGWTVKGSGKDTSAIKNETLILSSLNNWLLNRRSGVIDARLRLLALECKWSGVGATGVGVAPSLNFFGKKFCLFFYLLIQTIAAALGVAVHYFLLSCFTNSMFRSYVSPSSARLARGDSQYPPENAHNVTSKTTTNRQTNNTNPSTRRTHAHNQRRPELQPAAAIVCHDSG